MKTFLTLFSMIITQLVFGQSNFFLSDTMGISKDSLGNSKYHMGTEWCLTGVDQNGDFLFQKGARSDCAAILLFDDFGMLNIRIPGDGCASGGIDMFGLYETKNETLIISDTDWDGNVPEEFSGLFRINENSDSSFVLSRNK